MIDPFRLAVAIIPLAAYLFVIGLINARRRPFLTSGGCDLTALGLSISGLLFIGPMELLRPDSATRSFGNYIWLFLLCFYWLGLLLTALLARPRLVVYNISAEELHPMLAQLAAQLDQSARWAGNQLSMPTIGVHLHIDRLDLMRNVSLVSSGGRQSLEGWRRVSHELSKPLRKVRVKANPRALGFLLLSAALLALSLAHLWLHQAALLQGLHEVFAF
ncbi:MAG TPA: hypothetical protein VH107_01590 [Lacipirellulaceae bacterium]|jgi:hypothetical protein|nr:hypothetical protein [Lacipirellulaceae bacterium]